MSGQDRSGHVISGHVMSGTVMLMSEQVMSVQDQIKVRSNKSQTIVRSGQDKMRSSQIRIGQVSPNHAKVKLGQVRSRLNHVKFSPRSGQDLSPQARSRSDQVQVKSGQGRSCHVRTGLVMLV